jgi:hypothetical protein
MRKIIAVITLFLVITQVTVHAETAEDSQPESSSVRDLAPRLFLQFETWCDREYIKSEIVFVNYVRERNEADIHLIVTAQTTASGGDEFTLSFTGQHEYSDLNYNLKYTASVNATDDEIREGIAKTIKQGLVPFISRSPLAEYIDIQFQEAVEIGEVTDRWKNWVFKLGINGYADGEKSLSSLWYSAFGEANRITERQKFEIESSIDINLNKYTIGDSDVETSSRSYYSEGFFAQSLNEHFSLGGWLNYKKSEYSNIELHISFAPAIECNIFPYSEYAEHEFSVTYLVSGTYRDYFEETIYGKRNEKLYRETLQIEFSSTEQWGTISFIAVGQHYLHDFSKNNVRFDARISLRLFAGFSLLLNGGYAVIHAQLSLRKGDASEEEIYLRLRELETDYSYWVSFGVNYTFGSIYSNIVNPIF